MVPAVHANSLDRKIDKLTYERFYSAHAEPK